MIFPKFCNMNLIEEIRAKYDPLYNKVNPHITLVFPFTSEITGKQLKDYISSKLNGLKPFPLSLCKISAESNGYLFLNVYKGMAELIELHNRLYDGILGEFHPRFLKTNEYKPHMTIGRITDSAKLMGVVKDYTDMNEAFEDIVDEISIEIIDENENSIIEMIVKIESEF